MRRLMALIERCLDSFDRYTARYDYQPRHLALGVV